jgi:competence protein ComEC
VPRWHEVRLPDGTTGFVSKAWTRVTHAVAARAEDELRIHFLNVGTGSCTIVECPGANAPAMIVDRGSLGRSEEDMTEADVAGCVQNLLAASSAGPNVVLSHGDRDHYRYIASVLATTQADNIWQGGEPADYNSDGFPAWLQAQQQGGATVRSKLPADWHNGAEALGEALSCGLAHTYVLTVNTHTTKNGQSLVLMLEYGEFTAVFTGDAEGTTESREINNFGNNLKASAMSASHHGASTHGSNGADRATSTAPDVVVFSAGDRFGHPRCDAVNRFTTVVQTLEHDVRCGISNAQYGPVTQTRWAHYMTRISGTVIVTSNGHSPMALHCSRSADCGAKIPH